MDLISHALVLNLHQPAGNLQDLIAQREWEAREILYAMDRIPRFLWDYEDVARVHLSLSGTLLETLSSPEFQQHVYGVVDCGSLLWHLQNVKILQILGTAYYHSVLPLIPPPDREEQVARWLGIGRHVFWRPSFSGFWPPEMGFSMDLIPLLKRAGYRYVLVDSAYVEPTTPMRWEELRYRPHVAQHDGQEIVVVVRDRELSDAQESGMEYAWFEHEVRARTRWCSFPPLVTTCTDGENGGWFRNVNNRANFWGVFYGELCDRARAPDSAIRPTFLDEYLGAYGAQGYVTVRTGAWNTGWHHGMDFTQWTGSQVQKDALRRIWELSKTVHEARRRVEEVNSHLPALGHELESSLWHLLRAETSCYLYWGEAWVSRAHSDLDEANRHLARARDLFHRT
jgi:alpha-amylase/alpha-mannosidase (GH57 family)